MFAGVPSERLILHNRDTSNPSTNTPYKFLQRRNMPITKRVLQSCRRHRHCRGWSALPPFQQLSTTAAYVISPNPATRQHLSDEAAAMTKSLYRSCLRSIKLIRWGNAFDDKEFERREEDYLKPSGPGGTISMAPPPDKTDELRSRAEYYHSFAREYFTQESDCLDNDPWREKDTRRYLYYLRKGEKDRKWLLADMMFPDPYKASFDHDRVDRWETLSKKYLGEDDGDSDVETDDLPIHTPDNFFGEDEDPKWFQNNYPNLK